MSSAEYGGGMAEGMFRLIHEQLGEAVRMHWGADVACFLTRDSYEANRHRPPYDELPTREEYLADRGLKNT